MRASSAALSCSTGTASALGPLCPRDLTPPQCQDGPAADVGQARPALVEEVALSQLRTSAIALLSLPSVEAKRTTPTCLAVCLVMASGEESRVPSGLG